MRDVSFRLLRPIGPSDDMPTTFASSVGHARELRQPSVVLHHEFLMASLSLGAIDSGSSSPKTDK
jgi:hypothetical protein